MLRVLTSTLNDRGEIGAALVDSLVFLLIWAGLKTSGEEQQHAEEDGVRREQKNNGTPAHMFNDFNVLRIMLVSRLDISIGVRVPGLDVFFLA